MAYCYKRIRDLREDKDKTQQELADFLQVGLTTYRRWETGERTIPTNHVVDLARFYQVSTDYLLGLTNDPTPSSGSSVSKSVSIGGSRNSVGDITIK